jgi:hypothetical protein
VLSNPSEEISITYNLNNLNNNSTINNRSYVDRLNLGLNNLNNIQNNNQINQRQFSEKKYWRAREIMIISGLIILGILVQPVYLMFKFIELLLECYRRFGCWFYYGSF